MSLTDHYKCNNTQCSQPIEFTCGGCFIVYYCSKDCQRVDRPTHRAACRAVAICQCAHCGKTPTQTGASLILCSLSCDTKYCSDECKAADKIVHRTHILHPVNAISFIEDFILFSDSLRERIFGSDTPLYRLWTILCSIFKRVVLEFGPTPSLYHLLSALRTLQPPNSIIHDLKSVAVHLGPRVTVVFQNLNIPSIKSHVGAALTLLPL